MKIILERHAFAPEMNKAHILRRVRGNGWQTAGTISAPGCTSIADVRRAKFAPCGSFRRCAVIRSVYSQPQHLWLNKSRGGIVANYTEALTYARKVREGQLPDCGATVTIKTFFVGV